MDAVMSGQAAAMALIEGNDCSVVHSVEPERRRKINVGAINYLFAGALDVLYFKRISLDEAYQRFFAEVRTDESLRLTLILLDDFESVELRLEAARELAQTIAGKDTRDRVENILCTDPLPKNANIDHALQLAKDFSELVVFLSRIRSNQPHIRRIREEWEALPNEVFKDPRARMQFFADATKKGVFRTLVNAASQDISTMSGAIMDSLILLKDLPNSRSIVTQWTKSLKGHPLDIGRLVETIAVEERLADKTSPKQGIQPPDGYGAYQNVLAQQDAIRAQLRAGNIRLARRYMDELMAVQRESGGAEFAAMTLCKLAQEANSCGQYSLQLEWAKTATEIRPEDPVAYGHLADAYMFLNRFDDALIALKRIEEFGDRRFAETVSAGILRSQGRLDEALVAFDILKDKFGRDPNNTFAWNGYAEVLRDMWHFDRSLAAYEETIAIYPGNAITQCGRAAVLSELGRLAEAEAAYDEVIQGDCNEVVAFIGKASVLKKAGNLEKALAILEQTNDKTPNAIAMAGKANILRLMRRFDDALQILNDAQRRFPYEPSLIGETAELFRDQGKLEEALAKYLEGTKRFPSNSRLSNGLANIYKEGGDLKEALRVYDDNVSRFPYDIVSKSGRADLLKRLGDFDNAMRVYDDIMMRWPEWVGAKHSKAAILVVLEKYREAENLLSEEEPSTIDDWIASHVRGMILLKRNLVDEAIAHFASGLKRVPFTRERVYFQNALAAGYLRKKEFTKASDVLGRPAEAISKVLLFHAFAASGETKQASNILVAVQFRGSAKIIDLTNEIARRYHVHTETPKYDENWIFDRECEAILLEAA